ncbi:MAG: hypothetical protein QXX78_00765 [Nitrososphaerota archaeon]
MKADPFIGDVKPVKGLRGVFRRRIGDYRIISTNAKDGKIFAPIMVESYYKIDIFEWTKKALSLSQYSECVELEEGKLNVDWKGLIGKNVILEVTIAKLDGTIIATRYVIFELEQGRIRIYLGSKNCISKGVAPHDTVIVTFDFTNEIKDPIIQKILKRYKDVMGLTEEEVKEIGDDTIKALFGELKHCQVILHNTPEGIIKGIQVEYEVNGRKTVIDIETTKHLIDAKFWESKKSIEESIKSGKLIDQLTRYRNISMEKGKKVVLSFYKELNEENLNKIIEAIKNEFGEDWNNWLTICNGNHEFENFIINEYS